jgi:hypothetical protein
MRSLILLLLMSFSLVACNQNGTYSHRPSYVISKAEEAPLEPEPLLTETLEE